MNKSELASRLARQTHLSKAEAADRLDRLVHQIVFNLRKGQPAKFPGLGSFRPGDRWQFRFVAGFSHLSVRKKGSFQAEIRYALDCARRVPLDESFLIPVRLDDCRVPWKIRSQIHYIDLFPDWNRGLRRIVTFVEKQLRKRR